MSWIMICSLDRYVFLPYNVFECDIIFEGIIKAKKVPGISTLTNLTKGTSLEHIAVYKIRNKINADVQKIKRHEASQTS